MLFRSGLIPVVVGALGQVSAPVNLLITDPLAASLTLQLLAGLQISGAININYRIDYLTDVQNTNSWSPLATVTLVSNPYFWVDLSSTNQPRRLYRAVRVP